MSQVQSGILPEHCRAAIWIEANVKGEVDALRAASKTFADKLATFEAKFPDAHLGAVVAFGNNTWRALSGGVGAEELKDFPGYGKGLAPTTQFDVLIHILSLRHDVNFSVAQAAMEAFGDCIEVKEEIHGFRWVEERDLLRFKAFQQRVKYRMCQAERAINRLFNIAVKRLTGDRLDDKSKQHIIDITVNMLAAGLIL